MIEVRNLSFSYGKKEVIRNLSFRAVDGSCTVLAGPNGCGKSTLLSLMAGVLKAPAEAIAVIGTLGLSPQGTALFEDMSVQDNLDFFAALAHVPAPDILPFGLDELRRKRVSRLSGGSQRRVSLACALLGNPQNVLLDEPCTGLDLRYREELQALIVQLKAEGRAVLYVGHDTSEFSVFYDQLIFLGSQEPGIYERKQLSGSFGDLYRESEQLADAYRRLCGLS